ncbi:truncated eIF2 alpha-like PKR inhibitor [Vaccinia virus]|uniref:Truncated eIF2 alpha-like PKR inhibitor n=1 Tax=Vaccinia virus TaxID=10245 RepID=A0A0M4R6H5_VACCV|nr:truncated eIF2 alpha-like PKR inhibitor [Vaccinia virus]
MLYTFIFLTILTLKLSWQRVLRCIWIDMLNIGKTVKVKVIRVDYTKGYIDVNYKRMCRHQ